MGRQNGNDFEKAEEETATFYKHISNFQHLLLVCFFWFNLVG